MPTGQVLVSEGRAVGLKLRDGRVERRGGGADVLLFISGYWGGRRVRGRPRYSIFQLYNYATCMPNLAGFRDEKA